MKWLKSLTIVLAVLLATAAALPFFITFDDYIPRIEKAASARLKEPVLIKSIRFAALPWPHIRVEGITVGASDGLRFASFIKGQLDDLYEACRKAEQEHQGD